MFLEGEAGQGTMGCEKKRKREKRQQAWGGPRSVAPSPLCSPASSSAGACKQKALGCGISGNPPETQLSQLCKGVMLSPLRVWL